MHDGLVHSMSVDRDRRRRFESPRGQMCFRSSTKWRILQIQKHDQRRWPPLFRLCKMYKEPSLRPRPLWRVFPVVKKHIKENSVEAESSGSRWVKWNRSLVGAWKHNTVPNFSRSWGWYAYMGGHWKVRPLEVFCCRSPAADRPPTGHPC